MESAECNRFSLTRPFLKEKLKSYIFTSYAFFHIHTRTKMFCPAPLLVLEIERLVYCVRKRIVRLPWYILFWIFPCWFWCVLIFQLLFYFWHYFRFDCENKAKRQQQNKCWNGQSSDIHSSRLEINPRDWSDSIVLRSNSQPNNEITNCFVEGM